MIECGMIQSRLSTNICNLNGSFCLNAISLSAAYHILLSVQHTISWTYDQCYNTCVNKSHFVVLSHAHLLHAVLHSFVVSI